MGSKKWKLRLAVLLPLAAFASMVQHPTFFLRQAFSRTSAARMRGTGQAQLSLDSPLAAPLRTPWFPERKPLPERLVRLGHCMLVPALGASKQDDQLAQMLMEDINRAGKHLRMHRSKRHLQIWGEHLTSSKTFTAVVARLTSLFGMSMVDCWVNVYRNGGEEKSAHHDNYKDRRPKPCVTLGLSLGSPRDMLFRDRFSGEEFRVEQRNGDVFAFDSTFNNLFSHAIPVAKGDSGLRLSIIIWATAGDDLAVPTVTRKGAGFPTPEVVNWSDWDLADGLWSDSSALAN